MPIPVNYPVVGRDAFRTGTGVHAAAVIKAYKKGDAWLADRVYSGVPAAMVGREQEIEVGPMSGESNVVFWLERHGYEPADAIVQAVFKAAKASPRVLTDAELEERDPAASGRLERNPLVHVSVTTHRRPGRRRDRPEGRRAKAVKVLERVAEIEGFTLERRDYPFGAEHYLKTKEMLPASALDEIKAHGRHPARRDRRPAHRGRPPRARDHRGAALRRSTCTSTCGPSSSTPSTSARSRTRGPSDVDLVVVRENTEDVYVGHRRPSSRRARPTRSRSRR